MKENPYSSQDAAAARVAYLIKGFILKTLTEKEHDELDDWVAASDRNMKLFEDLTDEKNLEANLEFLSKAQSKQSYETNKQAGKFELQPKRITMNFRWIAAASVILLIGLFFIYRYTSGKNNSGPQIVDNNDSLQLKPGSDKAILTLPDGTVIDLTQAGTGLLRSFSHVDLSKISDGMIEYGADGKSGVSSALHTLTTPVGGQYQVRLPDGTVVWLNAATKLTYPESFGKNERLVSLDGEAYFEVAKDANRPFKVMLKDSLGVEVLGTHFNIMSYENENAKKVTLLEGSVRVTERRSGDYGILAPGEQAVFTHAAQLNFNQDVDTEEIIGWKEGWFVFHDAPIESIMRQVERWYDAKIIYQGKITQLFNATILRKEPLSKLLHILELNGYVHFKIENKTIYVLP